jgi:phosphoglycerate dehydrogenase-like enzyme
MAAMADIPVLLTVDFPAPLLERLRAVSPRLKIRMQPTRKAEDLPSDLMAEAEILYTARALPDPEKVPNLRWIQFHYSGIDHAVEHSLLRSEVKVTTLSGAAVPQMAEFAVAAMLALARKFPLMVEDRREKRWPEDRFRRFEPLELRGSTVGIVGYGSVGREIARICRAFGAKVLAVKRNLKQLPDTGYTMPEVGDREAELVARLYPPQAIGSMASECDFLVVVVPLTPATRGLVGDKVLKKMKPSAYLIDISRGGVVDHGTLIEALNAGRLAGAALDVYPVEPLPETSPLWGMPNLILSPHVAGASPKYLERATELFAENLRRYVVNEPLLNLYDPQQGY